MSDDNAATMKSLGALFESMSMHPFDHRSVSCVFVTHIDDPHDFYVRPTAYNKYLPLVEQTGNRLPPSDIQVGLKVMYKSKKLLHYVRGEVKSIEDANGKIGCTMFAFDYGIKENSVPIYYLRKMLLTTPVPPMASRCQLADCQPRHGSFSEEAINAMKDYLRHESVQMVIRENSTSTKLNVELKHSDDLATVLARMGYTNLGHVGNIVNRLHTPGANKGYIKARDLNVGEVLHVRTLAGSSLTGFYVAEVHDYEHYLNQRSPFTNAVKQRHQLSIIDLKPETPVGVYQYSSNFYERGVIQEVTVPGEKAVVKLVDTGNSIEASIVLLKPINNLFLRYPAVALYCAVSQDQVGDKRLEHFLCPDITYAITIEEIGDDFRSPNFVRMSPIF